MKNQKIILALIIFIISLLVRLPSLNAMGDTFDEIYYYKAGHKYIENIINFDFQKESWALNFEHPPLAKYIYGVASWSNYNEENPDYSSGRVASAFMGSLTVAITFLIALNFLNPYLATFSALLTSVEPSFLGLTKVYGLDSPTVFLFTLTVYLALKSFKGNKNKLTYAILAYVSLGLAISTRFNNALLFILIPLVGLIYQSEIFKKSKLLLLHILSLLIIPVLIFYSLWAWLWFDPIHRFQDTFGHWTGVSEYFLGKIQLLPPGYYLIVFSAMVPAGLIILLIIFILFYRNNKDKSFLSIWFLIPFLMSLSSAKQDGVRYILAIIPPLSIICIMSISQIVNKLAEYFRFNNNIAKLVICSMLIVYIGIVDLRIHPYYIDFFNVFYGGPKTVQQNNTFDFGWWGEGNTEAIRWFNDNAKVNASIGLGIRPNHTIGNKKRSDLTLIYDSPRREGADYIVVNNEKEMYEDYYGNNPSLVLNYNLVKTIEAGEAPLVKIYEKKL